MKLWSAHHETRKIYKTPPSPVRAYIRRFVLVGFTSAELDATPGCNPPHLNSSRAFISAFSVIELHTTTHQRHGAEEVHQWSFGEAAEYATLSNPSVSASNRMFAGQDETPQADPDTPEGSAARGVV